MQKKNYSVFSATQLLVCALDVYNQLDPDNSLGRWRYMSHIHVGLLSKGM